MRKLLSGLLLFISLSVAQAQIVGTLPFTFVNGVTADATQVMANYQFIINQVNANAANNGANSNITSLTGLTTPISPGEGGSQYYSAGTSTGSANSQVVSSGIIPSGFTLSAGKVIAFTSGFTNTGATTFTINGTAATTVKKLSSSGLLPLIGGEIVAGNIVLAFFDGTQYDLVTDRDFQLLGKQVTLASAATTDLGTSQTHNISISGVTTITSFGSSAQLDYPRHYLSFSGSLTLTYNATSLILPGAANIITQANDTAIAQYLGSGNWQIVNYQRANSAPFTSNPVTIQRFTSGTSLTYTPTAGTQRIEVEMCGGGGGGGGAVTTAGGTGGTTSFGAWTAIGGTGGTNSNSGGAGGTGGAAGTGTLVDRISGQAGGGAGGSGTTQISAAGANSPRGGAGLTSGGASVPGVGATANSCSGGGGASVNGTGAGGGGGAAEHVRFLMTAAQVGASQTYTVGAAGTAGTGALNGGAGGAGVIIVKEFPN